MASSANVRYTISPGSKTSWGNWGNWQHCDNNAYAVAFQLKTEGDQGDGDDTSLNSIALYCGEQPGITNGQWITSAEGSWGNWGQKMFCNDGFFIGAEFRSEGDQRSGDDTAGNNLSLRCSNGQDVWTEVNGGQWGSWDGLQICRDGTKICGLRTLVEGPIDGDDTALNAVEFACC